MAAISQIPKSHHNRDTAKVSEICVPLLFDSKGEEKYLFKFDGANFGIMANSCTANTIGPFSSVV